MEIVRELLVQCISCVLRRLDREFIGLHVNLSKEGAIIKLRCLGNRLM